jgi:hypothetical protein
MRELYEPEVHGYQNEQPHIFCFPNDECAAQATHNQNFLNYAC